MSAITTTTVQRIQTLADELDQLGRAGLPKAIEAGKLLRESKAGLAHGQWMPWLEENFEFSHKTAMNWMMIYDADEAGKLETVTNLTEAYRIASKGSKPSPAPRPSPAPVVIEAEIVEPLTEKESDRLAELEAIIDSCIKSNPGVHAEEPETLVVDGTKTESPEQDDQIISIRVGDLKKIIADIDEGFALIRHQEEFIEDAIDAGKIRLTKNGEGIMESYLLSRQKAQQQIGHAIDRLEWDVPQKLRALTK